MFSKEVVTEKRYCPKCDEHEFHEYSNTILMTEEDEVELQAMLHASQDQSKYLEIPEQDIDEFLPVLGAKLGTIKEVDEKFQQDYEASEFGLQVLRLL